MAEDQVPFTEADIQLVIQGLTAGNLDTQLLTQEQLSIKSLIDTCRVLCPYIHNMRLANYIFGLICLPEFSVMDVWGTHAQRKPFCRYEVLYQIVNPQDVLANDLKEVARRLQLSPINGFCINNSFCRISTQFGYAFKMEIGISESTCSCPNFFNETMSDLYVDLLDEKLCFLLKMTKKLSVKGSKLYMHTQQPTTLLNRDVSVPNLRSNDVILDIKQSYIIVKTHNSVGVLLYTGHFEMKSDQVEWRFTNQWARVFIKNTKYEWFIRLDHLGDLVQKTKLDSRILKDDSVAS